LLDFVKKVTSREARAAVLKSDYERQLIKKGGHLHVRPFYIWRA